MKKLSQCCVLSASILFPIIAFSQPANWISYKNNQYGFAISYPKTIVPQKKFDSYYFLPNQWRVPGNVPIGAGNPVINIPIIKIRQTNAYPRYFTTELRIGVSDDPLAIKNCVLGGKAKKNINGIEFSVFPLQETGMMQYLRGTSYRVVHNNLCFAIEKIETGSSYRDQASSRDISEKTLDKYYTGLDGILGTFRFLK